MISILDEKLAALRAEMEQAEAKISSTLAEEPEQFHRAVDLRRQFNEARSQKLSASQRLVVLRAREIEEFAEFI